MTGKLLTAQLHDQVSDSLRTDRAMDVRWSELMPGVSSDREKRNMNKSNCDLTMTFFFHIFDSLQRIYSKPFLYRGIFASDMEKQDMNKKLLELQRPLSCSLLELVVLLHLSNPTHPHATFQGTRKLNGFSGSRGVPSLLRKMLMKSLRLQNNLKRRRWRKMKKLTLTRWSGKD